MILCPPLCIDYIPKGSFIFRGSKDYAKEVDDTIWLIQRHPETDFKEDPVYFARETRHAGAYGCTAVFEVTKDIYTLALDNESTLRWLHAEAKKMEDNEKVKEALTTSFSLTDGRNSIKELDFIVARFICNLNLKLEDKTIQGYSSAQQGLFKNMHPEFAICSSSLRALRLHCLDTSTCEASQSKIKGKEMEERRDAEKAPRSRASEAGVKPRNLSSMFG